VSLDRLGPLSVSPNGRFAVFTRSRYNQTANKGSKTIEIIDLTASDGAAASIQLPKYKIFALTIAQDGVSDSEPVWISDSSVAFLRKTANEPVPQIYAKDISEHAETAACPLFEQKLALPVENLKFHLGEKFFTFTADVYADLSMGETVERDNQKTMDRSTAMVFDKLYFRHWDQFDNHKNSHVFKLPLESRDAPYNLMYGLREHSCPIPPHGDSSHYQISPDGQWLIYASMAQFDKSPQAWSTETNIYLVPTKKGSSMPTKVPAICITCDMPPGAKSNPSFSPDGKFIAWQQMNTPQFEADKNNLILRDRQTGSVTVMTAQWDRSVDSYVWSADSQAIYVTASDMAREKIFAINVSSSRERRLIFQKGTASSLSVLPTGAGGEIVFTHHSMTEPADFFAVNPANLAVRRLSNFHALRLESVESKKSYLRITVINEYLISG
jgi:dipeptidyl aminopeptidase/acylaminoacyl peptidase